jgi:hypothetical protein
VEPRSRIFFLPFSFTRSDCSGQALSVRSFAALCPAALWFRGHNRHGGRDLALHHAYIDEEDRNQLGRSGLASQRLPGNVPPDVAEQGPAAAGTGHSKAGHRGDRRSAEAELADYESPWARPPVHTNSLQPMAGASSGPAGIDERHRVGQDRSRRRSGAVNLGRVHKLLRGSRPSPRLPGHSCTPVGGVPLIVMM